MAVDTGSITTTYDTLYTAALAQYDVLYTGDKIDAETYAKLVGTMSADMMRLSIDAVQKQELLDRDVELKQEQVYKTTVEKLAIMADTADTTGYEIDQQGNFTAPSASSNEWSTHYKKVVVTDKQATDIDKNIEVKTADISLKGVQGSELGLSGTSKRAVEAKQALLVERQTKGFDDDAKQKLLKQALESWSVAYSVDPVGITLPNLVNRKVVDNLGREVMDGVGIDITDNTLSGTITPEPLGGYSA